MKNLKILLRLKSALVILLFIAACSKGNNNYDGNTNNPPPPGNTNTSSVNISGFSFSPSSVTVKMGATVTWTNKDNIAHTVTANDGSFDSGSIGNNATYSRTFNQVGTFAYHCTFHPGMSGSVIVQQ